MGYRLLLIEDDATIGEVLASSLRGQGHDVAWERTARAGLARAAESEADLILLGLGLPDLDGVELCRRLRHRQPGARSGCGRGSSTCWPVWSPNRVWP